MCVNSAVKISGTVPERIVSLTLKEVTSRDQGQWRLGITNDVGTGYVEFQLLVQLADNTSKDKCHDVCFVFM